jgi:hypothetical protein
VLGVANGSPASAQPLTTGETGLFLSPLHIEILEVRLASSHLHIEILGGTGLFVSPLHIEILEVRLAFFYHLYT